MAKIANWLIGCMIAFLPLYTRISSVNIDRISKTNALLCLIPAIIMFFNQKHRYFNRILKYAFFAMAIHVALFQFEPASIAGFYQAISICLGLFFVAQYHECHIKNQDDVLLNFVMLGALIQSVIAIGQFIDVDIYRNLIMFLVDGVSVQGAYVSGHKAIFGSLGNPNLLGAYLALCLPAFFRNSFTLYFAAPIAMAVYLSGSLIPMAASIVAIAYYFTKDFKYKDIAFLIGYPVLFYSFCFMFPEKTSDRMEIWKYFYDNTSAFSFLFGHSTSWFPLNIMQLRTGIVDNWHNEFIAALNIFGIGAIAVIVYMLRNFVNNSKKDKVFSAMFMSGYVLCHGSFPLHIAPTALLIMVALSHTLKGDYGFNVDR